MAIATHKIMEKTLSASAFERVPEHSLPLMRGMSSGEPFCHGNYLFLSASDWLMAIGYPLHGKYDHKDFTDAVNAAIRERAPARCYAIAPDMPENLLNGIVERDRYYILDANAQIPRALRNPVLKASRNLSIREGNIFTAAHRRLWSEFLDSAKGQMTDRVEGLYLQTPTAMASPGSLRLLDAIDSSGNIVASLLLDYAPAHFISYIIGAHSKKYYVPHATDLLFSIMLRNARNASKRYIHLGLGVNPGILRFKLKWGAKPYYPYVLAEWDTQDTGQGVQSTQISVGRTLALAVLNSHGGSARQVLGESASTKPFAMIWEVSKNNRTSWICGTAHFFCHSFEPSFRKLFKKVDNVIFEGPLDNGFMAQVEEAGKKLPPGIPSLLSFMDEEEIARLEKIVFGPTGNMARLLNLSGHTKKIDIRHLLATGRYWYVFFTLWTTFLERQGWHESVDMEAWRIANDMNRNVKGMESLEEQLESLGSLPIERVLRFFRSCGNWKKHASTNLHAYLSGDLEKMMGSSAEFPTRTEHVVGRRDQRFRERMRPYLEQGRTAVFAGSAHMVNLRHMLKEDGFTVTQKPFGVWPKMHLAWRKFKRPDENVTW